MLNENNQPDWIAENVPGVEAKIVTNGSGKLREYLDRTADAAEKAAVLTDVQIDDMSFGYCPSGKIGELRELCRAVEREVTARLAAPSPVSEAQAEPVAYLDLGKLAVGGMAYATSFRTTSKQTPLSIAKEAEQASAQAAEVRDAWVSVGERLPAEWKEVIIWPYPTGYCMTAELVGKSASGNPVWKYGEYTNGYGHETIEITNPVTHWMPLPEAPSIRSAVGTGEQA